MRPTQNINRHLWGTQLSKQVGKRMEDNRCRFDLPGEFYNL